MAARTTPYIHPCLSCGACCATYRVSFHYDEMRAESHGVPEALSRQISPYQNAMIGTDQAKPMCVALKGEIGKSIHCTIYENRPNCCRIFKASYEDGHHHVSCDEARSGKSLAHLTPADWRE